MKPVIQHLNTLPFEFVAWCTLGVCFLLAAFWALLKRTLRKPKGRSSFDLALMQANADLKKRKRVEARTPW